MSKTTVPAPAPLLHDVLDRLRVLPAAEEAVLGHLDSRSRRGRREYPLELAAIENAHGFVPLERLQDLVHPVTKIDNCRPPSVTFMSTETIHLATTRRQFYTGQSAHPNGPLYYVAQNNALVGLDIGLRGGPGTTLAGSPGYPSVLLDGSVVVPSVLGTEHLQLTFVRPGGAVETQAVQAPSGYLCWAERAVQNGQGGLLVQFNRYLDWTGAWDTLVDSHGLQRRLGQSDQGDDRGREDARPVAVAPPAVSRKRRSSAA